jgi:hypothetical protein
MALTMPLADDAAIFEYSYTTGATGVYLLAGAWGGYFPFSAEVATGAVVKIRVTDGSAQTEISNATYNLAANTLTVVGGVPITSTNGGALVNWSGRTRLLVHLLAKGASEWFISFSVGGEFGDMAIDEWDGNYEIFDCVMPFLVTFPADFATSPQPGCEVAPAGSVTLNFQTIHAGTPTAVGTLTIAGSALTGSLSTSGVPIAVPAGDRLRLYAGSGVDGTIAGVFGTIAGTR